MKGHMTIWVGLAGALLASASINTTAAPLGTAFTYQGRLNDGLTPADGSYEMTFIGTKT